MVECLDTASAIAANGPLSIRQAKKAIQHGIQTDLTRGLWLEIEAYNRLVFTEDRFEGVRAFNENARPNSKERGCALNMAAGGQRKEIHRKPSIRAKVIRLTPKFP